MDIIKDILKIDFKNFNIITVISILFLLAAIFYYLYWGISYGIWYDIGIYSITIVLAIPGIIGILLSLMERKEED
jgi:hypothetical protein